MSETTLEELRKHCGQLVTRHLQRNGQEWRWAYEDGTEASPVFESQNAALKWAEDWCGNVELRPMGKPNKNEGRLIRPGYWKKTYGTQKHKLSGYFVDQWVYQPKFLTPEESRPVEEVRMRLDQRSLGELEEQLNNAFQQLLARAFIVEKVSDTIPTPERDKAVWRVIQIVRGMVDSLNDLVERRPGLVNPIAETLPTWPVALSLNPQQITHATDALRSLGVGSKARTPTRPGQRVDPKNYFTQLATRAYDICRWNAHLTRELASHQGKIKWAEVHTFWKTQQKATTYILPDKSWVILPVIPKLSEPITEENFARWWQAVKLLVLHYWTKFPDEYKEALRKIEHKQDKESTRRNMAVDRVNQAFRSLVGVP